MEAREESIIFPELTGLCSSLGCVHAIAYFCFTDKIIKYAATVETEDVVPQFRMERPVAEYYLKCL